MKGDPREGVVPTAFVDWLHAHNQQAIGLALLCVSGALVLWSAAYLVLWGLALVAVSAWYGLKAEVPSGFAHGFAALAVLTLAIASVRRGRPPMDSPGGLRHGVADLALAPARLSWSALDNLRAVCRLGPPEQAAAWELASAIREAGRLELAALPTVVPDQPSRERAMMALQLAGLVSLRPGVEGWIAVLANDEARMICSPSVRLDPRQTGGGEGG